MNQQSQYAQPQTPSLSAVRVSPLNERLASLGGNIASLESEIELLGNQLSPVTIPDNSGAADSKCSTPAPVESSVEMALRAYDLRVALLWQTVSSLRAQLRV